MFGNPWLGQVPLVAPPSPQDPKYRADWVPEGSPPYFGEWGIPDREGFIIRSGEVGPYDTKDEAFRVAVEEALANGAYELPWYGYAQVKDSQGQVLGPII